jgi:integrase
MNGKRNPEGIRPRHSRSCTVADSGRCTCSPSWEASVYSARDGKKIRQTFSTLAAARMWRADASASVRKRTLRAPSAITVREAWEAWLSGARQGTVRTRSGDTFKPSALRGYEAAMTGRVLPLFGSARLSSITHLDLQDFADRLVADRLEPSTVRNVLMPVRAIYRRAVKRGDVAVNPTTGLELPAVRGRRDRIASPKEAASLLAALPDEDRAVWAMAMYAGLRRGELMAITWENIDLDTGVIRVERAFDPKAGEYVAPKSRAGRRTVPIVTLLREHLIRHRLRTGRSAGLVFGATSESTLDYWAAARRARRIWITADLVPIGMHECRHTFASIAIAAGMNAKALSTFLGHASVAITLDRYGHLMPGAEEAAAELLDAYLADPSPNLTVVRI